MSRRFDRQFAATDRLPYIADTNDAVIELASLDVQVLVTGLFAQTTQVLRLYNPNDRELEGNLCFPLPDGAVVCGYGLDVDGQLVDGVVVPKEEARRILETEIRKGVDPGLVEQVQGNIYRTRIYPLPARGSRTVKIVYVSRLTVDGNDAAYHLPLGHAEGVDKVSLRVEVSQTPVEPALVGGLGNLTLNQFENRWVAEAKIDPSFFARIVKGEPAPADDLQVRLPNLPDHVTSVERFGDADFFCVSSKTRSIDAPEPWTPSRIAVLWDASGSRQNVDRDIALLEALAEQWQNLTFDVRVLRDVVEPEVHSFSVEAGNAAGIETFLRGLAYDGGTNLAGADLADLPHADDEAWLLFSDGLGTVGTGLPSGTTRRIFAITGQSHSDSAFLGHLAQRSGGTHLNLLRTAPEKAAAIIASWSDSLRLEHAAGCEDVHVSLESGRLMVVGRLTEAIGSVALSGPGAPTDQLSVAKGTATKGPNIARAWAGQQAQLEKLLGSDAEKIVELGRTFGLVTPGTSLLVLESLDQYLEYDIEPPASLPEMRSEFHDYRRSTKQDEDAREAQQLDTVASMWEQRVLWWEKDFHALRRQKTEDNRKQKKIAVHDEDDFGAPEPSMEMEEMQMAPPPASAPAPVPLARMADISPSMSMREISADDEMAMSFDEAPAEGAPGASFGAGGAAAKEDSGDSGAQASIQIKPWSPDTPYLTAMKQSDDPYANYLGSRGEYAQSPAFFLDCSDFLFKNDERDLGLRVLSNLLELALDDPALLRMYAWRMQQAGELDQAIAVLERVLVQRDDEPQSHRDLALALELRWQRDGDADDATRAMELLYAVIKRTWDRFPEIELIALMELNRLIYVANNADIDTPDEIDARLIRRLDLDVRISMSWDADLTDVDLHVFEPTDEHAYYGHNLTEIGGLVSRDFTQGYGPEEYVLRKAEPGDYTIKTHYYGSHQQTIAGACTVIVTVFTNYARPDEQKQVLTLRLEKASDQVVVGTINIGGESPVDSTPDWEALFRSLKRGMSLDEIVAIVGQPNELGGSEEMVMVYRPDQGVELHVFAAPRLTAVQQLMDGATLDLI